MGRAPKAKGKGPAGSKTNEYQQNTPAAVTLKEYLARNKYNALCTEDEEEDPEEAEEDDTDHNAPNMYQHTDNTRSTPNA